MKKVILFGLIATLTVGYFACRKGDSHEVPKSKDPFLNEAIAFLDKQISSSDLSSLDLDRHTIINDENGAPLAVRIPVKDNVLRFIMVGKTKEGLIGNWVDLSKMNTGEQSKQGELITKSFDGKTEAVVSIVNNSVVKNVQTINGKKRITTISYENGKQIIKRQGMQAVSRLEGDDYGTWLPEVTVTGYRINDNSTWYSLYWYFNQSSSYTYNYTSSNPYSGGGSTGGGSGSSATVQLMTFTTPPGVDVKKFFKCFTNVPDAGATYTLTLHADLPVNSSPNTLVSAASLSPGHAFLTFTKSNGSTSVTQVIGFYPISGTRSVFNQPVASQTVNDGGHEYNASVTINVSQADFTAAQNLATTYSTGSQYDLNDFNCSNYALNVFNSATTNDISVSDTYLSGLNYGCTPNGLYNKLVQMKNGGASNVSTGTYNAAASKGACN